MVENGPEKSLELRSVLIAFHPLDGKHDAKNLAKNIIDLTDRVGVSDKVFLSPSPRQIADISF